MRKLLAAMLRIGFLGFGGGSALIPIIEDSVVKEDNLIDEDEFNKDVVIAQITPGALPVEIASLIGKKVKGLPGMVLAAVMMALPGALMTVILVSLIKTSGDLVLRQITFVSAGITAYIMFMLTGYTKNTIDECRKDGTLKKGIAVIIAVFLLTGGKELFQVFMIEQTPFFDISTINMLAIAFFVIFFTRGRFTKINILISAAVIIPYLLCVGKNGIIESSAIMHLLQLLMLALGIYGLCKSMKGRMRFEVKTLETVFVQIAMWIAFLFILSIPALIIFRDTLHFVYQGVISALLSFGGGDAYLALANGMFVNSGMVSSEDFYQNIVVVANAIPGSILCKVLSGIGFVIGNQAGGIACGYFLALVGFAVAVATSGSTVSVVGYIYERFETLQIFHLIKKSIRPIVSGLLLGVCASMLYLNMKIALGGECSLGFILILTAVIYFLNIFMKCSGKVKQLYMVIISAVISLICLNVYGMIVW